MFEKNSIAYYYEYESKLGVAAPVCWTNQTQKPAPLRYNCIPLEHRF